MRTHDETIGKDDVLSGANRRGLLRAAAGGLALAASGLLLPVWLAEEAEAREGALGGAKGGRRGKNHRGRHRHRTHGAKKDNHKPRGGNPLFRSSALEIVNYDTEPLQCTFFYRVSFGLDDYSLPIANGTHAINGFQTYRYDPDRERVGVLIKQVPRLGFDLYVDVRNIGAWFPRGGVTQGSNLDPANGNFGTAFIPEQNYSENERHVRENVYLHRLADDSKGSRRIEWLLTL